MYKYFCLLLLLFAILTPVSYAQHSNDSIYLNKKDEKGVLSDKSFKSLAYSISERVDKKRDLQYFKHEKTNFLPHQSVYNYVQALYLDGQKQLLVDYLSYKILLQKSITNNEMSM